MLCLCSTACVPLASLSVADGYRTVKRERLTFLNPELYVACITLCSGRACVWPAPVVATGISKALETSYTRVLAQQLQDRCIMVNACCPG